MGATPQASGASETKAGFLLRLRAKGVRDLSVLKALETMSRDHFVPHRYADLAARDIALPIGCGQILPEPFFVARAVEALSPSASARVLEVGCGSGYTAAILARLFRDVLALERYRTLADHARARLQALGVGNAAVVWGDGLDVPAAAGSFDRIIVHAALAGLPTALADRLAPDGVAVFAYTDPSEPARKQHLVRATRDANGAWTRSPVCPSRLRPLVPGLSRAL